LDERLGQLNISARNAGASRLSAADFLVLSQSQLGPAISSPQSHGHGVGIPCHHALPAIIVHNHIMHLMLIVVASAQNTT
jgi:hypothetical protein